MAIKTSPVRFRATDLERDKLDEVIKKRNDAAKEIDPFAKPVNRNQVLQALVRNFISLGPNFLADEILTLKESNRRLLGIGRNLNQVIKKIHAGEVAADALTVKYLERVAGEVGEAKRVVDSLVEHNLKRGQVGVDQDV